MGSSRHYTAQLSLIAGQQSAFKKAFKVHYLRRLRKNHSMAVTGKDQFAIGYIVLITDLSISQKQAPYPAVGIVERFVDDLHAQAVVRYGGGRVVDRPLALLTKLVPATESILNEGVMSDPFILGDDELEQQEQEEEQVQQQQAKKVTKR